MIPETKIPESAAEATLQRLKGRVTSYITRRGTTIEQIIGEYTSAKRYGVPLETIMAIIRDGLAAPPNADADRVAQIMNVFLNN